MLVYSVPSVKSISYTLLSVSKACAFLMCFVVVVLVYISGHSIFTYNILICCGSHLFSCATIRSKVCLP